MVIANAIPIYSNGGREDPGNHRFVSLSTISGQVMEKIVLGDVERP